MEEVIQLLRHDPDLAEHLHGERLERAIEECLVRVMRFQTGDWSPPEHAGGPPGGLGLLILEGMVVRRVGLAGRFGTELLGEGDLLRPWQDEDLGPLHLHTGRWRVLQPGRIAILDLDFARRVARYPELISCFLGRAVRRSRYMAANMAIINQPRIDTRLQMLLWELAARWGSVHRDGVHLPIRLTHATLAELVAARRPTVTKALGELAECSLVAWTGEHWLLKGRPPSELEAIGSVSVGRETHPSEALKANERG